MKQKLLSVLLALAMALTLLPGAALAAEEGDLEGNPVGQTTTTDCQDENCSHVAAIGTTHYDTIQAAIDAATDGRETEITVLKAVTSAELVAHIKANDIIVLNLNGKTITSSFSKYTVSVASADAAQTAGGHVSPGKLTIIGDGAIYNSSGSTAVRNYGEMVIGSANASAFPTIGRTDAQPSYKQNSAIKCEEASTLTIKDGTFEGAVASKHTPG